MYTWDWAVLNDVRGPPCSAHSRSVLHLHKILQSLQDTCDVIRSALFPYNARKVSSVEKLAIHPFTNRLSVWYGRIYCDACKQFVLLNRWATIFWKPASFPELYEVILCRQHAALSGCPAVNGWNEIMFTSKCMTLIMVAINFSVIAEFFNSISRYMFEYCRWEGQFQNNIAENSANHQFHGGLALISLAAHILFGRRVKITLVLDDLHVCRKKLCVQHVQIYSIAIAYSTVIRCQSSFSPPHPRAFRFQLQFMCDLAELIWSVNTEQHGSP